MKKRFYVYAFFFSLCGIGFFWLFMSQSGPESEDTLQMQVFPSIYSVEERLKRGKSVSATLVDEDNRHFMLKEWFPEYDIVIKKIKDGQPIEAMWSGSSGTVYQLFFEDGHKIMFSDAVSAEGESHRFAAIFWLILGALVVIWALRKAR